MRAGELHNRVTIQSKTVTQNTFGEEVIVWAAVATVWAAVEPLLGREYLAGRLLEAEQTTRIRIRYRAGVAPEMRVIWDAHIYDIQSVQEVRSERRELVLMCKEIL